MRLLIYRFGQIGDTVACLPALWLLRERFPEAEFTLLSDQSRSAVHLGPAHVLPAELMQEQLTYAAGSGAGALSAMAGLALRLRRRQFDALAYLVPSTRTRRQRLRDRVFFSLTGIPRQWGFEGFPEDAFPRAADGGLREVAHEADALLARLAASGFAAPSGASRRIDLALTEAELGRACRWWQEKTGLGGAPARWFAMCCGTKWPSKKWEEERFFEVGRRLLTSHGLVPVIFGGPEDRAQAERLIARWGAGFCAAGDLTVRESAALLRGAAFYLGNDTGVMHLAAAEGVPCVAVFAAIDWPGRWHPHGAGHEVLRTAPPCSGCMSAECPHENLCLRQVSVDQVAAACERVLAAANVPPLM